MTCLDFCLFEAPFRPAHKTEGLLGNQPMIHGKWADIQIYLDTRYVHLRKLMTPEFHCQPFRKFISSFLCIPQTKARLCLSIAAIDKEQDALEQTARSDVKSWKACERRPAEASPRRIWPSENPLLKPFETEPVGAHGSCYARGMGWKLALICFAHFGCQEHIFAWRFSAIASSSGIKVIETGPVQATFILQAKLCWKPLLAEGMWPVSVIQEPNWAILSLIS